MLVNLEILNPLLAEIMGDPDSKKIVGRALIRIPAERRESAIFQLAVASGIHKSFFLSCIDELRKK
jgi:hypothetical protein